MNASERNGEVHGHPLFEERQRFAAWVYVLGAVAAIASLAAPIVAFAAERNTWESAPFLLIPVALGVSLLVLNMLDLETRVFADQIYVKLGGVLPIMWKRIALRDVIETRSIQYRPLRDAGGWGMRFGRFDGKGTTFWNARGNLGVLVVTARRPYVIGSQDPESLRAAIDEARENLQ